MAAHSRLLGQVLFIALATSCLGRTVFYSTDDDASDEQKIIADLLNDDLSETRKGRFLSNEAEEQNENGLNENNIGYLTDVYNMELENILDRFSRNTRHKKTGKYTYTNRLMLAYR